MYCSLNYKQDETYVDSNQTLTMFVSFGAAHSSNIPVILNIRLSHISPQNPVVFDDDFSTVSSLAPDSESHSFWNDVDLE